jgi:2-keto-4-pentenoate hydratase/2-oxohepta-3-ene-1,7-dioic acid hydratase in catechol pathway
LDHQDIQLKLKVNDKPRQDFNTSEMIHKIDDQIAFLSKYMNLNDGDMILTGTGGGVEKVLVGD